MHVRIAVALAVLASPFCFAATAASGELDQGVGRGPHAVMHTKFEVTFMKIDVADVTAHLSPVTSERIAPFVESGRFSKDQARGIERMLLDGDTLEVRMTYLRDADLEKLLNGIRKNLEAARKADVITAAEFDSAWPVLRTDMLPLEARGVKKGDELIYRVEGPGMRAVFRTEDGQLLVDQTYTGDEWARGVKGSFFSKESRFRDPLIRSLFEAED